MENIYDNFADALAAIVAKTEGATWEDKANRLQTELEAREGAMENAEELLNWLLHILPE